MLSIDSSANHKLSRKVGSDGNEVDQTLAIARQTPILDPKPPIMCDHSNRCALHLVAQYSESLELLQNVLEIDPKMTNLVVEEDDIRPLGKLCRRPHFPTFDKMVLCLIQVDSSVEVISDGIILCMEQYEKCLSQIISPGSSGKRSLTLIRNLLDANPAVTKYDDSYIFHAACRYLRGELGVSVLSLLLSKDSTAVKVINRGNLPIHLAARYSCLDVVKFLLKAYPESISMLGMGAKSLLHLAVSDDINDIAEVKAKVQYLCDQCPALIHLKDIDGDTALHAMLKNVERFNLGCVKILCIVDATVVRYKRTPDVNDLGSWGLPLHSLIRYRYEKISEVSDEGDCFRLLLRLYPAAAGIKDGYSTRPYDLAVYTNLSTYFIRLLLSADPTIHPVRRRDLNFAARRQGMFLAFRALSSNVEPTIWAKMRLEGRNFLEHVISYL
jgi:hypothetical protein